MRYLPLTDDDRRAMLKAIGVADIDALYCDVPPSARLKGPVDLPRALGEMEVERALNRMAMKNLAAGCAPFFLGAGAYRHHIPAAVDHLVQRGEFLTSYTPYQPEITQGTLQYLFEFQTQVTALTGMEVANASLYDGASACAEALTMAVRVTNRKKVVLSGGLHPHWRDTARTQARFLDITVESLPMDPEAKENMAAHVDGETACVIVQNPGFFGQLRDLTALGKACHKAGALLVVAVTEPVSLGAVMPPGSMGADIVVGEGQSLGGGLNFGGPYLGLFATRSKFVRQMPGRLVGQTVDVDGRRGWVLTLSTREQHIRREKATSNICTNSGLCALAFSMHLTFLGEAGLTRLAQLNHAKAVQLAEKLAAVKGAKLINDTFFNEFTLRLAKPAADVVEAMAKKGVLGGVPVSRLCAGHDDLLLVCATETANEDDMNALAQALTEALS